ncbi:MAG: type II toxin-antitoxin system Phd/YefM family antitoxin [Candidatus Dormibacteria bacterium]
MQYGIRELKDGYLSRAVKQATQGEEVVITDHGRPVAKIIGYPPPALPSRVTDLVLSGRLELRAASQEGIAPVTMLTGRKSAVDYVKEQRR